MAIQNGDRIGVEYTGTLEDGSVFDSSKNHKKPLVFEVGAGQVIKGFDNSVIGKEKGDKFEVTVSPEEGYGEYKEELKMEFPNENLPENAKEGDMVLLSDGKGQEFPSKILEIKEDKVKLDMNYPLAGKTLKFEILILEHQTKQETDESSEEKVSQE
ncbi:peptidylprolyl isomerase [Candidatus Woesearchaeota archaeon]|jgi:FKBP-type peptidyl-prolyl cis-trans isomerase 2|nr:peptidylprolyl isomerase [Candidatus Woesearchaeota archaeon]MBT4387460.1 peptidylprolyl isomerase [Candidatus Woesearchaeota archaeon]MBT4595837.1 peptidylprolyl isomerase [Candidatus Woesearchaeota archaeon]MBT5741314.1 peptidylprolyl isomerase [Candidatus Woesearchaeota archaeon]MBT6506006.1 peptidylprolyl isomerase [Candidatus Woesearchaeota archaeon]